jgi:ribosomal protein S18 acetylase RimI-like enzyme
MNMATKTIHLDGLYRVRTRDVRPAAVMLTDAFQRDPIWKVILSDATPAQKISAFETPLLYCLKYGRVYATSENLEGVAAWLPGASAAITPWRLVRSPAMPAALRLGWKLGKTMEPIFGPLNSYRKEIMGDTTFVYLQIIGVATSMQGRGFGGTILRALIGDCDRAGTSLYLETETEENVRIYQRFGFGVARQIALPVIDLPMWLMVRH